jgi:hypothetical protein
MGKFPNDPVRVFVGSDSSPEEYDAFFEDTVGDKETPPGGYLYVKKRNAEKIIRHLKIYQAPLEVKEDDIEILWSSDGKKCGISIWGRMRGIINLADGREISTPLESRESPAIADPEWLDGFEYYLDQNQFIRARQRYWKRMAKRLDPSAQINEEEETPIETDFVINATGPDDLLAVFEDNRETGYLYLYDSKEHRVVEHLLIYDRSEEVNVVARDLWVGWSDDGAKCGVAVWNKMRGIIDRVKKQEGRIKLESRSTPGIVDPEWLKGFEYLYSKPN